MTRLLRLNGGLSSHKCHRRQHLHLDCCHQRDGYSALDLPRECTFVLSVRRQFLLNDTLRKLHDVVSTTPAQVCAYTYAGCESFLCISINQRSIVWKYVIRLCTISILSSPSPSLPTEASRALFIAAAQKADGYQFRRRGGRRPGALRLK